MSSLPAEPYVGRLACDGEGNLLADEGEYKGVGVYHDVESNSFKFVEDGGFSHNQRFHQAVAVIQGTTEDDPHHFEAQPDDAHYDPTAPGKARDRFHPDAVAATQTSHTEAYTNV